MASKKRATKKAAARKKRTATKRTAKRSSRKKATQGGLKRLVKRCAVISLVAAFILGLTYLFAPYSIRGKMEQAATSTLYTIRNAVVWPSVIERGLNTLYDAIPHSEGLIVDGGELGHDSTPHLAGVPTGKQAATVLHNKSCTNVFSTQLQSSACLAYYVTGKGSHTAHSLPTQAFDDTRIPKLRASHMTSGKWSAHPLVQPNILEPEFGQIGCNEAMLTTQLSPMHPDFASGIWQELLDELFIKYPQRFGEVWIYIGPIYSNDSPILPSRLKVPTHYYAIAFDLTETGGLRAIAFVLPSDASGKRLSAYISTIGTIEQATGLNFMPDMEFDASETLRAWLSPRIW